MKTSFVKIKKLENDKKMTNYQSKILPTNGEIKVTPASAHATAWANENKRVKLQ